MILYRIIPLTITIIGYLVITPKVNGLAIIGLCKHLRLLYPYFIFYLCHHDSWLINFDTPFHTAKEYRYEGNRLSLIDVIGCGVHLKGLLEMFPYHEWFEYITPVVE